MAGSASRPASGAVIAAGGFLALAASIYHPVASLAINASDSLPGIVYRVASDERHIGRGDVVALRPPPNRFFPRPLGFLKVVRGVPGDVVTRDGRLFLVNGEPVGVAKSHAHNGEPLTPGPEGVIPPDHYFVWSPHPDSFDSRYADIGWIASDRILGRADRLL